MVKIFANRYFEKTREDKGVPLYPLLEKTKLYKPVDMQQFLSKTQRCEVSCLTILANNH